MLLYIPGNSNLVSKIIPQNFVYCCCIKNIYLSVKISSLYWLHVLVNVRTGTLNTRRWSVLRNLWQQLHARSMGVWQNFAGLRFTYITCVELSAVSRIESYLVFWEVLSTAVCTLGIITPLRCSASIMQDQLYFRICYSSSVSLPCATLVCHCSNYACHPRMALMRLTFRFHISPLIRPASTNPLHMTRETTFSCSECCYRSNTSLPSPLPPFWLWLVIQDFPSISTLPSIPTILTLSMLVVQVIHSRS